MTVHNFPVQGPPAVQQLLRDAQRDITRKTIREAVRDMGLKAATFETMHMPRRARLWAKRALNLHLAARDAGLWGEP